ncbi:BrnT family toxin [Moraxella sp. ZY210820]|uniref:BrnT family toxin n=1 Tax=unclassified Moraxella TaxID=2685852 RepID=UPI002730D831|nr:BrnT family toxin [Moraxella sp. ZY210820]WLF84290.1 BrnT family toxin [Moraxella sp. ZY210820]
MSETIISSLYGMIFEWDKEKEHLSFQNHGVHFSEAITVFLDPYNIIDEDYREYGETRYITVGMSSHHRLLKVIWTDRDPNTRIISAWKATAQDKKAYEYNR